MTREEFERRLHEATEDAINFARTFVSDRLPKRHVYYVALNQSYDGHAKADEITYPAEDGQQHRALTAASVIDLLYRDGRCPVWIDISAAAIERGRLCVQLRCAGRYTANDARLYYRESGPFGIKSPAFPPRYRDHPASPKFPLPRARHFSPKPFRPPSLWRVALKAALLIGCLALLGAGMGLMLARGQLNGTVVAFTLWFPLLTITSLLVQQRRRHRPANCKD